MVYVRFGWYHVKRMLPFNDGGIITLSMHILRHEQYPWLFALRCEHQDLFYVVAAVRWTCEKYIVRGELFGFERIEILVVVMYVVKAKLPEMVFDLPCAIVWVPNAEVFFRFANPLGKLDEERCDVTIRLEARFTVICGVMFEGVQVALEPLSLRVR